MNYKEDLGFAMIQQNSPIEPAIKRLFISAYQKNKNIFRRGLKKKFNIIICNDQEEWKKECKYYYFPEAAGTVLRDSTLIVKSLDFLRNPPVKMLSVGLRDKPKGISAFQFKKNIKEARQYNKELENYLKIVKRKNNLMSYRRIIYHEMNHVFWAFFYKTTKPVWMQEGLACILGISNLISKEKLAEYLTRNKCSSKILKYRYLSKDFVDYDTININYTIWMKFILFITRNNPSIIVKFMDEFKKDMTKQNYNKLFLRFFGVQKDKFNQFLKI